MFRFKFANFIDGIATDFYVKVRFEHVYIYPIYDFLYWQPWHDECTEDKE